MDPYPPESFDSCYQSYGLTPSINSVKPLCNAAAQVSMPRPGLIRWIPAPKDSYGYRFPGPYTPNAPPPILNCKDLNASGLLKGELPAVQRNTHRRQMLETACQPPSTSVTAYFIQEDMAHLGPR
jgi:hypothetical protein